MTKAHEHVTQKGPHTQPEEVLRLFKPSTRHDPRASSLSIPLTEETSVFLQRTRRVSLGWSRVRRSLSSPGCTSRIRQISTFILRRTFTSR